MKEVVPGEIWARITSMPRPSAVVPFPRNDDKGEPIAFVRLVVLSSDEQQQANAAAEAEVRRYLKGDAAPKKDDPQMGYEYARRESLQKHLLWYASRAVEDAQRRFFARPNDIGEFLSPDEIGTLMMHYLVLVQSTGPTITTVDDLESWAEAVARSGNFHPFVSLSQVELIRLATTLASRLWISPTANSSLGTSPECMPSSNETSEPETTSSDGS